MGALCGDGRFVEGISIDWNAIDPHSYLRGIPAIRSLGQLDFDAPVTFFVGENGSGKSTLLEAIAVAYGFNAEGGTLNYRFSTYDDVSDLGDALRVGRGRGKSQSSYFLRAESFFNVATKAREYVGGSRRSQVLAHLHEQSHGEGFLEFFNSFDDAGLYLMDEPEAALSPQRQLSLLINLNEMSSSGSQFIIATHSPILLGLPGATILNFDGDALTPCTWEETDSYRITEMFINRRDSVMRRLMER
jgi:predicted ATPase